MTKPNAIRAAVVWALAAITAPGTARAYDAIVSWSPVSGAAGYRVYVRESGKSYGGGIDAGRGNAGTGGARTYRVTGLNPDVTTYFALSSYSAGGAVSGLSNELSLRINPGGSPGGLTVDMMRMVCDSASARDSGRLKLRARVDDASGLFQQSAADGALGISIRDAGVFSVTFDLSDCQSSGSIRCSSADGRARAKIRAMRGATRYTVAIRVHHLSLSETGPSPAAPVAVTLHQGSTLDLSTEMGNCNGHGSRALQCEP